MMSMPRPSVTCAQLLQLAVEVGDGRGDGRVHAADELDGVEQQFAGDVRVRGAVRLLQRQEDLVGSGDELAGVPVDEGELPLDAHRRSL